MCCSLCSVALVMQCCISFDVRRLLHVACWSLCVVTCLSLFVDRCLCLLFLVCYSLLVVCCSLVVVRWLLFVEFLVFVVCC